MAPMVVDSGKALIANRMLAGGTEPKYVATGTGNTAEAAGQTALVTEVETRVAGTSSRVTTTVANDTYQVVGAVAITATRALVETALFDAASAGNMLARAVHASNGLSAGDSITYTWQIKVS